MDCHDCLGRLYSYLDKELSVEEVAEVRVHLEHCEGCGDHFAFEERLLARIRDACTGERAPERLRHSIVLRLRRR